jgi:type II secretory pathway component GspD/PulD (secretin)
MRLFGRAVPVLIACLVTTGQAAEQSRPAKSQPLGTFQVEVSKDKVSLNANQASLVAIFQEIGKQAKITFDSNIGPEEKITIQLDGVPIEDGIRQLAKNATVFYAENPKDKTRRITRVVVLTERSGVPEQVKPPSQPEKAKEAAPPATTLKKPVPQPESFKFEFDPAKTVEKEKAGKQP